MSNLRWLRLFLLTSILLAYVPVGFGEEAPGAGGAWADTLLRQMGDYLRSAEQFKFRTEVTTERVMKTGQKLQFSRNARVYVRRPNKLFAKVTGDLENERIWYDGEHFTILDRNANEYETAKVPGDLDKALDHMARTYGESSPLADLVYSDPYSIMIENVKTGYYVGLHEIRGVKCHHLAFTQDNIDWQIWIEDGGRPVPCKAVITYKNVESEPQFTALLYDWDFSPHLPDALFKFYPPAGAVRVEFERVEQ